MSLGCSFAISIQRQLCNCPKPQLGRKRSVVAPKSAYPCIHIRGFHHSFTIHIEIRQDIKLQ